MLKKNCLTFSEIGSRVGLTRERVRQIAKRAGVQSGRDRIAVCSWTRADAAWAAHPNIAPVIAECEKHGYMIEAVVTRFHAVSARYSKTFVTINGHSCRIGTFIPRLNGLVQIHGQRKYSGRKDFIIRRGAGRWLILPWEKLPEKQTGFMLNLKGTPQMGNPADNHNWRDYLDAWHLLA